MRDRCRKSANQEDELIRCAPDEHRWKRGRDIKPKPGKDRKQILQYEK